MGQESADNPDLSGLTSFQKLVLEETLKIPEGKTITYSELARRIGKPESVRACASALSKNPYPFVIPCHRVVSKQGIGGYFGKKDGPMVEIKRCILEMESKRTEMIMDASSEISIQDILLDTQTFKKSLNKKEIASSEISIQDILLDHPMRVEE